MWIDSHWIEPHFRKQGIGKMLIEKVLLLLAQHKLKEVQLNTYFKEAYDFFLNCDFEDVAGIFVIPPQKLKHKGTLFSLHLKK